MEGDEPLLDRLHVVVGAPRGLGPLEQALGHRLVRDLEVEDVLAGSDRLLELLALSDLARVAVDEEALGAAQLCNHRLGQQVKHGGLVENNRGFCLFKRSAKYWDAFSLHVHAHMLLIGSRVSTSSLKQHGLVTVVCSHSSECKLFLIFFLFLFFVGGGE